MEYKRAAVMLPLILRRAMILTAICLMAASMIAFCATTLRTKDNESAKLKIGYTAEENIVTNLAVSYVQNMESIQSICDLEAVTEQEGKELLRSGALSALIVLPTDVINEILSGSNTPATLYLPQKSSKVIFSGGLRAVGEILFEEIVTAGMGMLGTAQAEIYAVESILEGLSPEALQLLYDDINQFNLRTVTGREKLFRTNTLSLTENDTYVVYYGSAFLTVYALFAGLFFGVFCKRSSLQQTMVDKRIGLGYAVQFTARCLAGFMLMAVTLLLPFGVLMVVLPRLDKFLTIHLTLPGIFVIILITFFMTMYFMMLYQLIEKRESALVVIGTLAVLQAYLSGCLIPSVLLPRTMASIGKLLPAAMIKKGFTILITGETQALQNVVIGLVFWGLLFFVVSIWSMQIGGKGQPADNIQSGIRKISVPSLGMVLFRRFLHRKSIWISLFCIWILSSVIIKVEHNAQAQIKVGVYDESGDFTNLFREYNGLVQFELYENEENVQEAVQKGKVECGYILPKALVQDMIVQKANREIVVYQDADAVMVSVVNEIVFERVFRQVSLKWFTDYLIQNNVVGEQKINTKHLEEEVENRLNEEILSGTTFRFEMQRFDIDDQITQSDTIDFTENKRTFYPIYLVAAIAVVLCTIQGILQVMIDVKQQNFYRQNRFVVSAITLLYPVLIGIFCAFLILINSY